ncbi:XRE family transcriptional regulator [Trabulsiella odontotermitis]|uniref:XRE family transcriptional regulator n=1 Tax=Trabulsiella odontotermitis TaxID=379893 RepID=UPI003ACA8D18
MEIKLHANATTTPRTRKYLQESDKSDRELARELGISVTTVRRWRNRSQIADNHTTPHVIHKALRHEQEALINALRDVLRAPLDELLFMVNEGLGIPLSRATLNRYLRPAHEGRKESVLQGKKALKAGVTPDTLALHYRLLALPMDDGGDHHLLWTQEPVSGWCYARLFSGISPALVDHWLDEALTACPVEIQCIETDPVKCFKLERNDVLCKTSEHAEPQAIQTGVPLAELIPALDDPDRTVQRLCQLWNTGRAQKKLGEKTPQAFLEALRQGV